MVNKINTIILLIVFLMVGFPAEPGNNSLSDDSGEIFGNEQLGRVGQYGYPGNPNYDRAIGFLLKGKVKNAQEAHEAIRPSYMNNKTVNGENLSLTIDLRLQEYAELLMKNKN